MFNSRQVKGINLNAFSSKLLSSSVHTTPALNTNEFANQLRDYVVHILDDLAPMRRMTSVAVNHRIGGLAQKR